MLMLTDNLMQQIANIGRERVPAEACGVLLPEPYAGSQVWEMPNRSKTPHDSFEMLGSDIVLSLEGWFAGKDDDEVKEVVIWHTHPRGNIGPSRYDMRNRLEGHHHLVISLTEGDAKASWY